MQYSPSSDKQGKKYQSLNTRLVQKTTGHDAEEGALPDLDLVLLGTDPLLAVVPLGPVLLAGPGTRAGALAYAVAAVDVDDLVQDDVLAVIVVLVFCAGVSCEGGAADVDCVGGSCGGKEEEGSY